MKLNINVLGVLKEFSFIFKNLVFMIIESSKSGHLGLPLGNSRTGSFLFLYLLNFYNKKPYWTARDRFVLSAGHGSIFLYTYLFLTGFNYTLKDLKNFRCIHSKAPGHPEYNVSLGIEATTGPLGQGLGNAVGMAIAHKLFTNKIGGIFNHKSFIICFVGDGCLQEGISYEATTIAGLWKLSNLIIIYDNNGITLDAPSSITQFKDANKRFLTINFEIKNLNKINSVKFINYFLKLKNSSNHKPKILIFKSVIGFGIDEIKNTNLAHGETGLKYIYKYKKLNIINNFRYSKITKNWIDLKNKYSLYNYRNWLKKIINNKSKFKKLSIEYNFIQNRKVWIYMLDYYSKKTNICTAATRDYSFNIINNLSLKDKFLISGSADLFSSTKNYLNESRDFNSKGRYCGKNLRLGVREHCMGSLFNGINYFGYFKTYCSTFLVFSDYLKPALRLSALAGLKTNYIFTHDSILVGQDGPTHQPIETLANLQTLPNLKVIRPSSFVETLGGYMISYLTIKTPVCLILSRQKIEVSIQSNRYINLLLGTLKGAFILKKELNILKLILISTGSEVALALEICHNLSKYTRLVSIPCIANFLTQSRRYVDKITPPNTYTLIIEFGIVDNWFKFLLNKKRGFIFGVNKFGFSSNPKDICSYLNLNTFNIVKSLCMYLLTK